MIPVDDPTTLSLLFHLNSEPWLNDEAYAAAYKVDYRTVGPSESALPLPVPSDSALARLIHDRCSVRRFEKRKMPIETLSTLLWAANGLTRQAELPDGVSCINRSVPSAGGLYPLEIYLLVQRLEATPGGLYHYGVWDHTLEPVQTGATFEDFRPATLAYPFFEDANVVLFLAAVFARTQRKYGPRGYRYILLEAGHAAQNICLAATEKGLGSLCIGGYLDGKLNRMLSLDPAKEGVVYAVAVGFPSPAANP